jgi:hypothetical protein
MNVDRLAFGGGLNHCLHRKSLLVVVLACLLQPCLGAASEWRIDSGGAYCQVDGACVTDGAGNYGDNEYCRFTLTGPATLTREEFGIQGGFLGCYDWLLLQMAGTKYCDGYNATASASQPGGLPTLAPNGHLVASQWCPQPMPSKPKVHTNPLDRP